jgi:hypothetical protein
MGMGAFWQTDRFLARALLASIVLHLIFAYFIPSITSFAGTGPAIETLSFVKIIRLSVKRTVEPKQVHAATAPVVAPKPAVERHPKATGPKSLTLTAVVQKSAATQVAAQTAPGAMQSQSNANANATPSTEQMQVAASNQSRADAGGYGPFGAENPTPVLAQDVHKQLVALGVHVTLTIVVDTSGHTKSVAFNPPLSNEVEDQIRTILANASWDAATCGGGIHCEGKTTITL